MPLPCADAAIVQPPAVTSVFFFSPVLLASIFTRGHFAQAGHRQCFSTEPYRKMLQSTPFSFHLRRAPCFAAAAQCSHCGTAQSFTSASLPSTSMVMATTAQTTAHVTAIRRMTGSDCRLSPTGRTLSIFAK